MGWLRDLMQVSEPPYKSYGALARAALTHRDWPKHTRTQARSLASIFSKLDRDQDREWLADRESVQRVLAELLSCPMADVRAAVDLSAQHSAAPSRLLRLDDLRYARALDLTEEALCPGLPAHALQPATWGSSWWNAPSGAGRSLLGRWLEARGLARHVAARTWSEALARLPGSGPVLVELPTGVTEGEPPPHGRSICVAAPGPAPASWDVTQIESPPLDQYLDDLIDWVAQRVSPDGNFDPEFAGRWLRAHAATDAGLTTTLGSALGLCGLIDELGAHTLRGQSLEAATARFFEHRIAEVAERADARWLKKSGYPVLLGMVRRILTDSDTPWSAARGFDEWLDLVPVEHQQGADVEWMRLTLLDGKTPVRAADIDRAARRLPPGAFRVLQALRQTRLLVSDHEGEKLRLRPLWFGNSLTAEARRLLIESSPLEWGEALLRPHGAEGVERLLRDRVGQGDATSVDHVLELESDDSPAHVASLEAVFRCVGLAVLSGAELPTELLEAVWNEQLRLLVELPGEPPRQRIAPPQRDLRAEYEGAWLASALSISEQLPAGVGAAHKTLRPWDATSPPVGLRRVLDAVHRACQHPAVTWSQPAFALADRLRGAIGSVGGDQLHPLEQPGAILEEIEHGVLSWETVQGLGPDRASVEALDRLARARAIDDAKVVTSIWNAWHAAGAPSDAAELLGPTSDHAARFWPGVTPDALEAWLRAARPDELGGLCSHLDGPRWELVLRLLPELGAAVQNHAALWDALPVEQLRAALEHINLLQANTLTRLWERCPEPMGRVLGGWMDAGRLQGSQSLIEAAPGHAMPAVLSMLEPRIPDVLPELLHPVRRWLHDRVAGREANWLAAYALLAAVERDLDRTRGTTR